MIMLGNARTIGCGALLLIAWPQALAFGQPAPQANPPLVIASMSGRDLFEFYCTSCHGRDARGGGPVAAALKSPPPDLTLIVKRNGGSFPTARIEALITGDGLAPAHGSKEMPVWGPIFRGLDPRDTVNKVRVANLASYLKSLQRDGQ